MSANLEWNEPTAEELAEWEWGTLFCRLRAEPWTELPQAKRDDRIAIWRSALANGGSVFILQRDAYVLARAVELERRVEEAYNEAHNEVLAFGFEPPSSRTRKLVERRDALQSTLIEARQRVDALTAKVLGRQS